ncbi:MAG: hypothetical protein AB7O26_16000 [Planctomycetaceae bacterium]
MVAWNELTGSPSFEVQPDGAVAERRGLIAWGELDEHVAEIFPPSETEGTAIGQGAGAPFPGRPYLRADSIRIQPFGDRIIGPDDSQEFTSAPEYAQAVLTVRYATPKDAQSEDESNDEGDPAPFLRHRWSVGGEFLSLPASGLEWAESSDVVPEDINAGIFVPTIEHEIRMPRVTAPPFSAIRDRIGTVNSTAISFSTGAIDPETLLFLGAEMEREVMSDGSRAWNVSYRFSERRVYPQDQDPEAVGSGGWNHCWLGGNTDGGWFRLLRKNSSGSDQNLFRKTSFSELFQPEPA